MNTTASMDLYKAPLSVWVEDQVTHDVLKELWAGAQINVLVASGKLGVSYMTRSRPDGVQGQVFGIVDRDFDEDNQAKWLSKDVTVLSLPVHELENLLLDFEVLHQLCGTESPNEIEQRAKTYAEKRLYFMACKAVLRTMQNVLGSDFPADPPQTIASIEAAAQHLANTNYWTKHAAKWNQWNNPDHRWQALVAEETRLSADLQSGAWLQTFSGKELFRYLRGSVPKLHTPKMPSLSTGRVNHDLDLAKRIAAKMVELDRIPPVITELKRVLRTKAGLPE